MPRAKSMLAAAMALAAVAIACGLLVACQRERSATQEVTPVDLTSVGTVSGQVRFVGAVPGQSVLDLGSSADCAVQHTGPVYAGDVLVHDGRVENALVYVKEGLGERVFAVPTNPVVVDQKACLFAPRVVAAQVDQPIRFLNSDPLVHNVRGTPERSRGWNVSLTKGASSTINVNAPEPVIEMRCDIHPWMTAYVGVFSHPYFAVTGADGGFNIRDLPAGSYVLEAWHERFGTRATSIALAEKESKSIVFVFGESPPR